MLLQTQKLIVYSLVNNEEAIKNEGNLNDVLLETIPNEKGAINAIILLYREGIVRALKESIDRMQVKADYAKVLTGEYGLNSTLSKWAVETWYYVLFPDEVNDSPGKRKCKLLRDIRVKIAEANDIDFAPIECNHFGDCRGTCYICDSELKYLNDALEKKKLKGMDINLKGISSNEIEKSGCMNQADIIESTSGADIITDTHGAYYGTESSIRLPFPIQGINTFRDFDAWINSFAK